MSFKPGHKKIGGRTEGTRNKKSHVTTQQLVAVLDYVGGDGNGKDGVVGYFKWLAKCRPKVFLPLLARVLRLETPKALSRGWANETQTTFELNETLRKKTTELLRGRPPDDPGVFEELVHLSVESPKAFAQLLGAVLLAPPNRTR